MQEQDSTIGDFRDFKVSSYTVEANPNYLDFGKVSVTKIDDTKPWKPALEVSVTKQDGSVEEGLDATTPFFTFKDKDGNEMTVSAATAGHIDSLHIKGEDLGSKFSQGSLDELCRDAAGRMPEGIATAAGVSDFAVDMKKPMGKEGLATLDELVERGIISLEDLQKATSSKEMVKGLNASGAKEEKQVFIDEFLAANPESKVQFQLIRGDVLVPVVNAPKQDTTKLFMVFGPGANGKKTLYTMAPGRHMPRHPNPGQHKNAEGVIDQKTFDESAEAWFNTAMLTGK
jgi:hypothetical protein